MNDTTPRNISRTWKVDLYGSYGEGRSARVSLGSRTVTLTADAHGHITGEVDGAPATEQEACRLLNWAKAEGRVTLLSETRTPAPIGNAAGARLHRLMGRLGVPSREHYAFASAALDAPVYSLAALLPDEARAVWAFLTATHPAAA